VVDWKLATDEVLEAFDSLLASVGMEGELMDVRHPEVVVPLAGQDGNAFSILGRVRREMQRAEVPAEEIKEFFAEATANDYDHLLQTVMRWVTVE
jgi:hypothetical protein